MSQPRAKPGSTGLTDQEIAGCFNSRIGCRHRVRLLGGAAEPLYLPAAGGQPAIIRYTRDYAASALHEIAHWCVAGRARRTLEDYGYFYQPPPRRTADQRRFMEAELKVQALEMLLARACGLAFHVSVDDPSAAAEDRARFERRVRVQARRLAQRGIPGRGRLVLESLQQLRKQQPGTRGDRVRT